MTVLGITGGIACGKSFVSRLFVSWGAEAASADDDAREVVMPGTRTVEQVFAAFPEARTIEGTLNRELLARLIFANPKARAELEAILHPVIFVRMQERVTRARQQSDAELFIYEVPLLFEKKREELFDATLAVICSPDKQAERLQARERLAGRPELPPTDIAARLASQLPNSEKATLADFVIYTDGTVVETENQARSVWKSLVGSDPH